MNDIRQKWKRLFSGNAPDALREELEQWAREAEAGPTIDEVCAKSAGTVEMRAFIDRWDTWPNYSTDGAAAMRALERIPQTPGDPPTYLRNSGDLWRLSCVVRLDRPTRLSAHANTPTLAIARCVAVLAARGVLLGEVGGE